MNIYDFLKEEEGCRLTPYQDQHGIWTVGYGHNCQATPISQVVADLMFKDDVVAAFHDCERLRCWSWLDEVRRAALLSMRFQMGLGGLLGFRKLLAAIDAEEWEGARREVLDSDFARQTPARAQRVAHMLATGLWGV